MEEKSLEMEISKQFINLDCLFDVIPSTFLEQPLEYCNLFFSFRR